MKRIKSLNEIDYTNIVPISFLATVISVDSEGDGEKKPFKATLKLEETGENFQVFSWNFSALQNYKELVNSIDVYEFEAVPSLYRDTEKQIRTGTIRSANMKSGKKVLKTVNSDEIKNELVSLVNTYIPKTSVYRIFLDKIFSNNNFWKWPAATKMHHAYPGGLAKHTLNVCKNAISIWQTYSGSNCDIKLIVAGAILHDIGKLFEYNEDGSRTNYGNLIPHPIAGYEQIVKVAIENNIDPEKNIDVLMLEHIILSHHEKLEFGAPCQPGILEALVVARADALDAAFESADKGLDNISVFNSTDRIPGIDGMKMLKWHN